MGVVKRIELADGQRAQLERVVAAASSEVRMVERARIVLCAAQGLTGEQISERVGCSMPTVVKVAWALRARGDRGAQGCAAPGSCADVWPRGACPVDRQGVHPAARHARRGAPGALEV